MKSTTYSSSFATIKRKSLEDQKQALIEEYRAASAQLARTLSEVDRARLGRQLNDLEQQITKAEAELADLDPQPASSGAPGGGLTTVSSLTASLRRHLEQEYSELETRYDSLTRAIGALDTDISRTTEEFRKQPLRERRDEQIAERDQFASRMAQIEAVLSQ